MVTRISLCLTQQVLTCLINVTVIFTLNKEYKTIHISLDSLPRDTGEMNDKSTKGAVLLMA